MPMPIPPLSSSQHISLASLINWHGRPAPPAGFIFLQGASIDAKRYIPLLTTIQSKVSFPLHVAIPDFLFDLPLTQLIKDTVRQSIADAKTQLILKANATSTSSSNVSFPLFLGGHSLGTTAVLEEAYEKYAEQGYNGVVITGASLLRKFKYTFPVPVLSVNGELDGLNRVR
jgi:hypothetical protein